MSVGKPDAGTGDTVLQEVKSNREVLLASIYELRVVAWRDEIYIPDHITKWCDEVDLTARHWVILRETDVLAAARLSVHFTLSDIVDWCYFDGLCDDLKYPTASLNRCVVHPMYRRYGLATKLDFVRIRTARDIGCRSIVASTTNINRAEMLKTYGFDLRGEGKKSRGGILDGQHNYVLTLNL